MAMVEDQPHGCSLGAALFLFVSDFEKGIKRS